VDEIIDEINQSPEGEDMNITQDVSDGTINQELIEPEEQVIEDYIKETQPSTSGLQKSSDGTTSKKNKKPTGHQILDKLKNSIRSLSEGEGSDNTPVNNSIESLKVAKNVIEKKLSQIENYLKLTINVVYETGECLRLAKKLCKKKNQKFGDFLTSFKKYKMKPTTANHYIRIYKLCKEFPKFLLTAESFNFYINNHKQIREALDKSPEQSSFWSAKE
jgi:hypothetical protein